MWAQELNGYPQSGSRLTVTAACLGAVVLLYGGSFFTRDWRAPAFHQPGQPLAEQAALRPIRGAARPMTAEVIPAEPPRAAVHTTRIEPEVTSALPRGSEPLASSPAAATSDRAGPSAETPPPGLAQAAAPKPVAQAARLRNQAVSRQRADTLACGHSPWLRGKWPGPAAIGLLQRPPRQVLRLPSYSSFFFRGPATERCQNATSIPGSAGRCIT
jgi:hypothetical protein